MTIKGKELINISAIGIISGFIVGLVKAAPQVAANRYIQYKMFTLTALSFREITYYIIYFTAGLALLHIAATFVFKHMKWKKEKIFMLETMLLVPIMGAFIIDHLLRTFTYYTLGLGIQRFFRALAGLFSGENGISGFLQLLKKNIAAFLFFAVGIAAILILFRLALKINWNRAAQFMENNPPGMCCMRYMRYIRRTAFVLITAFLLLNAGLLIRGKHTPDGSPNIVLIVVDCLRADHLGYY
ncbi:MAG: hypothetical protein GY950_27775, partial [bacterium]|nr:hypothetical protein [bacterium]